MQEPMILNQFDLMAFEALDDAGRADLEQALVDVLERFNTAEDDTCLARADYLQAVAVRA